MRTPAFRPALAGALAAAAVIAGLVAAALTVLLHAVQHLAFGYAAGPFEDGVLGASAGRRVVVLTVCGVVAGVAWYVLGRLLPAPVRVRVAVRDRVRMRPAPTVVEGLAQIVVVGLGASLGRESAPRRISGALGQLVADRFGLGPADLRLVVACAAGAGFGAVYDVPLAGTLFVAEVLLRTRRPGQVAVAAVVCTAASVVAWIAVPRTPLYLVQVGGASWALVVGALLLGPVAGGFGAAFEAVTSWAGRHRPSGWHLPAVAVPVFAGLGVLAVAAPSLLGNGRGPASLAFGSERTAVVLLLLAVAKPLVTAACLRTGVTGGLVTPAFATGALLGAGLGALWASVWAGSPTSAYAALAAAGVLTVTMRAPFTALAFAWEITAVPVWFLLPMAATVVGAWALTRPRRRGDGGAPGVRRPEVDLRCAGPRRRR